MRGIHTCTLACQAGGRHLPLVARRVSPAFSVFIFKEIVILWWWGKRPVCGVPFWAINKTKKLKKLLQWFCFSPTCLQSSCQSSTCVCLLTALISPLKSRRTAWIIISRGGGTVDNKRIYHTCASNGNHAFPADFSPVLRCNPETWMSDLLISGYCFQHPM